MGGSTDTKELFTASEVARFCQVDLKTIHNWADRGEIRHFRTPGRHLRFRRVDVLDFLRRYGYPVPDLLQQGKPRVHVIDEDATSLASVTRGLADSFDLTTFAEPVDALIAIGADAPDVVVLDANGDRLDGMQCIARLKAVASTRHARIVVFSSDPTAREPALNAGASAFVGKPDVQQLRATLQSLLGVGT